MTTNSLQQKKQDLLKELAEVEAEIEAQKPKRFKFDFGNNGDICIVSSGNIYITEHGCTIHYELGTGLFQPLRDYCNQCLDYIEQKEPRA